MKLIVSDELSRKEVTELTMSDMSDIIHEECILKYIKTFFIQLKSNSFSFSFMFFLSIELEYLLSIID